MMNSNIEYSNGEEVIASLIYERLEKHCSKCFRLDHDLKDCLEVKAQLRALKERQDTSSRSINPRPKGDNLETSKTGSAIAGP